MYYICVILFRFVDRVDCDIVCEASAVNETNGIDCVSEGWIVCVVW